jgi:hypothetical protein
VAIRQLAPLRLASDGCQRLAEGPSGDGPSNGRETGREVDPCTVARREPRAGARTVVEKVEVTVA